MNLFIDTNVFLSFYHLSSDDLDELKKLDVLIRSQKITLRVTDQLVDEFARNRATKIADAIKRIRDQRTAFQFPQFCKDYAEYSTIRDAFDRAEKALSELMDKVQSDIASQNLKADHTTQAIFSAVAHIPSTPTILDAARLRMDLGSPPGKDGSLGDAINWESLLAYVPNGEDLVVVSGDKDFTSPLSDSDLHPYLAQEWRVKKNSSVRLYRRLSAFVNDSFPQIRLEVEQEKEGLIRELAESYNFSRTHEVVAKLSKHVSDFSPLQVNDIVTATISNSQVYWILNDLDVNRFVKSVVKGRERHIDPEHYSELCNLLGEVP